MAVVNSQKNLDFIKEKQPSVDGVVKKGKDWLHFFDALGRVEGSNTYNIENSQGYMGIYQFAPMSNSDSIFKTLQFDSLLGKMSGVTTKDAFKKNPVVQELAALMEFTGGAPTVSPFNSAYSYVKSASTGTAGFNSVTQFNNMIGQTFKIQWVDSKGAKVGSPISVTFTQAGVSVAAHLIGQAGVALAMKKIYDAAFNPDTGSLISPAPTIQLDENGGTDAKNMNRDFADGSGVSFATYANLFKDFNITTLIDSKNADFNGLAKQLITYRKDKILTEMTTNKLEADLTFSIDTVVNNKSITVDYRETIRSVIQGLGLPDAYLDSVDGHVVLAGGNNTKFTNRGDLIIGLGDADNVLAGDLGNDVLIGGNGSDTLKGGADDDTLIGGTGRDRLEGGTGFDTYFAGHGDIISDTGDSGEIKLSDIWLTGGTRKEGDPYFLSADGKVKYKEIDGAVEVWANTANGFEHLTVNATTGPYVASTDTTTITGIPGMGIVLVTEKEKPPQASFTTVQKKRYDPLTLDLNGNGLATVAPKDPPILFDHQNDGIKESTGWVAPSDGFLVKDRDGNGTIDSGAELFGDSTPLASGGKAVDGFDALAQEDTNGDGVVDAQDAGWADLQVWQDKNQDGISQADELSSLDQLGIAGINIGKTANDQVLANGNQIADLGSFVYADGTTGSMGAIGAMADINLAVDTFHRTFVDSIPLTPEAIALPEMGGSGMVRDLREATSMQTPEGAALQSSLTQYAQATTREAQMGLIDTLLADWGTTTGFADMRTRAAENGYTLDTNMTDEQLARLTVLEQFNGRSFYRMPWESGTGPSVDGIEIGAGGDPKHIRTSFTPVQIRLLDQAYQALHDSVYEVLLPQTRLKPYLNQVGLTSVNGEFALDFSGVEAAFNSEASTDSETAVVNLLEFNHHAQSMFTDSAWEGCGQALLGKMLGGMPMTPSLKSVMDIFGIIGGTAGADTLTGTWDRDVLLGGGGDDALSGGSGSDTYIYNLGDGADTIVDDGKRQFNWQTYQFEDIAPNTLQFGAGIDISMLSQGYNPETGSVVFNLPDGGSIDVGPVDKLAVQQLRFEDGSTVPVSDFFPLQISEQVGTAGADQLTGQDSVQVVDHLKGMDGNDTLNAGAGDDLLEGGTGNDTLSGGEGTDSYIFNIGDGADTIIDSAYEGNEICFGAGITLDTVSIAHDLSTGNVRFDLGGGDSIVFGNLDQSSQDLSLSVDSIVFADGTRHAIGEVFELKGGLPVVGNDATTGWHYGPGQGWQYTPGQGWHFTPGEYVGPETLAGARSVENTISSLRGNDTLIGGDRNDLLVGGQGQNTIHGGYGNDTLIGGAGYDELNGGAGSDTYVYNLNDGDDTIIDTWAKGQTLKLGAGVTVNRVEYINDPTGGENGTLVLYMNSQWTGVRIENTGPNIDESCPIQQVAFDDGTVVSIGELINDFGLVDVTNRRSSQTMGTNHGDLINRYGANDIVLAGDGYDVVHGNDGNDRLDGGAGSDSLHGGAGEDRLYGRTGNDTLDGGAGRDILDGGAGDDRYILNSFSDRDQIFDSMGNDRLVIDEPGITQADVVYKKVGFDLVVSIRNSASSAVIKDWFLGDSTLNAVEFSDASVVDLVSIGQNITDVPVVGTAAGETLIGTTYNDTLEGGAGDDTLIGGVGDDVYRFNLGDGVDAIYELSETPAAKGSDTLEFGAGITPDMLSISFEVISDNIGFNTVSFPDPRADLMLMENQRQVMNIQVGDQGDAVKVMSGKGAVEKIRFADGSEYSWQQLINLRGGAQITDSNDATYQTGYWDNATWTYVREERYSPRTLDGTGFAATFDGGVGDDVLIGGEQGDVYRFNVGDGQDVIVDFGGTDEIAFGAGISVQDVTWSYDATRATPFVLQVGPNGVDGAILIKDGERGAIERFTFADGTVLSFDELISRQGGIQLAPSDTNGKYIYGSTRFQEDSMAYSSADLLVGTDGADSLSAWGSYDHKVLIGGKGDDSFRLSGDGNDGDSNTLIFNPGDGKDTIDIWDDAPAATLMFGPGVDPASVEVIAGDMSAWGDQDMLIRYGNGDEINIYGATTETYEYGDPEKRIRVKFADGTEWSYEDLQARSDANKPPQQYLISNQPAEHVIVEGAGGTDSVSLEWDWNSTSELTGIDVADQTTLEDDPFGLQVAATANSNPPAYHLTMQNGNMSVHFDNGVVLHIAGVDPADPVGSSPIRNFNFANGVTVTIDQLVDGAFVEQEGTEWADAISGTGAHDHIVAGAGDDSVTGGQGNDTLEGGSGSDSYSYNAGDGTDIIVDSNGHWEGWSFVADTNVLSLGAGIDPANVSVKYDRNSDRIYLDMGGNDRVIIGQPGSISIQTVQFADGTSWDEWTMVGQMVDGALPVAGAGGAAANAVYSATLADGSALPAWLSLDSATGQFTGTPDNWDVGSLSLRVTATDASGASVSTLFALDVLNVNDAPTADSILAGQSVLQDQAFSFTVPADAFSDVDFIHGDSLAYSAAMADGSALPAWLNFDPATGTFSGTPDNWDVGMLDVVVTATDTGGLSASSTFVLNVVNVNDAPVAADDASQANEDDAGVVISAANLLANDVDIDAIHGDAISITAVSQPISGATVSLVNGDVRYEPGANFQWLGEGQTTTDTFTYTVTDSAGATSTATVTMTITGTNDAPVVAVDTNAVQEDVTLTATGNVLANDSDIDQGDVLSVANAGTYVGIYGTLTLNTDGSYSYVLDNASMGVQSLAEGQVVSESFDYQATDGLASTPSTLTVSITGTNDAPIVVADTNAVQEDVTLTATGNVLANDYDIDQGDVLSVANAGVYTGIYGTLTLNADGSYSYALDNASMGVQSLAEGQVVTESFDYVATDGMANTPSTLTVSITGTNDAPIVAADTNAVQEDVILSVSGNVLANDYDIDQGDVLSVANAGIYVGTYGTLTLNADGSYSYALDNASMGVQSLAEGQVVTESFDYVATDGMANTPSTLTVSITGTNDAPIVAADTNAVQEDVVLSVTGNVLANDSDIDQGDVLSVANAGIYVGTYGTLTLNVDGSYSYALDNASMGVQSLAEGQVVTESFDYVATDGMANTPSVLTVSITGTNDAPIVAADVAAVQEDVVLNVTGNVLANDYDIDQGDVLSVANAGVYTGTYGTLTLNADGSYSYALDNTSMGVQSLAEGQIVTESFDYIATDGMANTPSTLTVSITGTNDAPIVVADVAAVQEDVVLSATGNVLSNDSDIDQGDVLSVANAGSYVGTYGTLTLNGDGSYTYVLDNTSMGVQSLAEGQVVTESFDYVATDGIANTPSSLTLSITGTNDAPIIVADVDAVQEDVMLNVTGNVLANDHDIDQGDVLSVANAGTYVGIYGTLTLNADGSYSYVLDNASMGVQSLAEGQVVTESFDYVATDGMANTPSTLTVSITGTNDAPIVVADTNAVQEDVVLNVTGNVLANDHDIDQGDVLSVANAGTFVGTYGTLTLNADGSYSYALDNASMGVQSLAEGQVVTESFDYVATDGMANTPSTLTVSITGTNDAPIANIALDDQVLYEGVPFTYQMPADAFIDIDQGDVLSYNATLANGDALPDWLHFDPNTQTFSSDLPDGAGGLWDVTVTATDLVGASASSSFQLDIANLILGTPEKDDLVGTAVRDVMYGFGDDDRLTAGASDDVLVGGTGNDVLHGNEGNDILIAEIPNVIDLNGAPLIAEPVGESDDEESSDDRKRKGDHHGKHDDDSEEEFGNNLLDGGAGRDTLIGGGGNDLLIGGAGDDLIRTDGGSDIIAFNAGDGRDVVQAGLGEEHTLSLGGGITLADLSLSHVGNDLVLEIGASESITLSGWYAPDHQTVSNLQMISQTLRNENGDDHRRKHDSKDHSDGAPQYKINVQTIDFGELVGQFDESGATDRWSLTHAKLDKHFEKGDEEAMGGDLAAQYALRGSMTGISLHDMQDALGESSFGTEKEKVHLLNGTR